LRLSLYYFSFLAAYFYSASGRDPRTTILGLSIFLLVLTSISSPADYFFGNPPFMNNAVRVSAFFVVHPMAYSFLVFVPLTIYLLMRDEPHTKQSFLLLAAGFAALALTHSRNYTVAFVLIFGWDFVRRATTIPSLVVRIPLIMAPAVLIPLAFPEQFVRVTALLSFDPGSPDSSTDLRFLIWTNALQAFFGSESSTGSDLGTLVTFSLI
jgi:O-antigen ligase